MRVLTPVLIVSLFFSCTPGDARFNEYTDNLVEAHVPVYAKTTELQDVSVEAVQATKKAGKIYAYGVYIFQNELNEGVHVIDNSNPADPGKIAFIRIPYNTEMAVRGRYMYANSIDDLLVVDIRDPLQPVVVKTIKNAFPLINQNHPPGQGFFVCADPAKGIVVDWELQSINMPACRR